jgi:hypothetical protein
MMTVVAAMAVVSAMMPAVMSTMSAAVTATRQDLCDAKHKHERQSDADSEKLFHRDCPLTDDLRVKARPRRRARRSRASAQT